jgi:hypothetical protein
MEAEEDEDDMLPWHVDDHCHENLTKPEFDRALPGDLFKFSCRGKEKGNKKPNDNVISSLRVLIRITVGKNMM